MTNDGILAIELLSEDLIRENPLRAALFLLAVLFPEAPTFNGIRWKNVDFVQGTLSRSGRTLLLPERILELLELARDERRDEPEKTSIFKGAYGHRSRMDYIAAIRASFQAYKQSRT